MSFSPTLTHDSKSIPGVKFVVHRMGLGRRTDLDFSTLTLRQRLRELEADYPPPSDREKELTEQLEIAKKKALAVPEQAAAVMETDLKPLAEEIAASITPEVRKRRTVIDEEYAMVDARIRAQWVRVGLIGIEGGELDGMTADQLLDYGPSELAQEIYGALASDGMLRGLEKKASQSLGTSGVAAVTESPNITVTRAESGERPST